MKLLQSKRLILMKWEISDDEDKSNLVKMEIGYVLNLSYFRKAYMPEALNCLINYLFNNMNVDLIWCSYYGFNNSAKRVSEKCKKY